jgi:hypothetical protein
VIGIRLTRLNKVRRGLVAGSPVEFDSKRERDLDVVPVIVTFGLRLSRLMAELPWAPGSPGSFAGMFAAFWPFLCFVAAEPAFREGFAAVPASIKDFLYESKFLPLSRPLPLP